MILTLLLAASLQAQDIPPPVQVQDTPLALSGVQELVAEKLKEVKGAALCTFAARPGAAGYLPIWTWHTADGTPLVEFPTIGYRGVMGSKPDAFTTITLNLPGVSEKWFRGSWFDSHVTKSKFPPIFFGPALIIPTDINYIKNMRWDGWKDYLAILVSVRGG